MTSFTVDNFVFDPRPENPFLVTAKRYRNSTGTSRNDDKDGLTLIFAHGTGFHKEQWEPTIEELSSLSSNAKIPIREIWSIDCPNHGDAATLNEQTLLWGYESVFGWTEYATSLYLFLTGRGQTQGIPSDYFNSHKLVGIGHSMGAISILLTKTFPYAPAWHSIILVEPMLLYQEIDIAIGGLLEKGAEGRRDVWPSKEEAFKTLSERKSFKAWDPRVLRIFCEQGLRDLPTAIYPDKTEGVTLKCTKVQEAACYRDKVGRVRAYNYLKEACKTTPVHAIYGAIDDYTPAQVKSDIINNASGGLLASVQRVLNAGHLVVQTHPNGLAKAIHHALTVHNITTIVTESHLSSRL